MPRASKRINAYSSVASDLDLSAALVAGAERNDLLPPRPEDGAGGQMAARFLETLAQRLRTGRYEPDAALVAAVNKPGYGTRVAAITTLADRTVYHALVEPLRGRLEKALPSDRFVYWPRAEQADKRWREFERVPLSLNGDYVVRADVAAFYESVDHELLSDRLIRLTGKTALVDALREFLGQLMGQSRGLPQGLTSSDVLATAYLTEVDAGMLRAPNPYWRHGDDIRMLVRTHDEGRRAVHRFEELLRTMQLTLNAEKTRVLHRETYEKQLSAFATEHGRIVEELARKKEEGLSGKELEDLAERAGLDEETQWGLFYHGTISLDQVIDKLRPLIKPSDVETARAQYDDAVQRAPDANVSEPLAADLFHVIVVRALTTLSAGRDGHALGEAADLQNRYPDKTEHWAAYLHAMAASEPDRVLEQVRASLDNYMTGWQQAWMLQVGRAAMRQAPPRADAFLEKARELTLSETVAWLARVEAARVLAEGGKLDLAAVTRLWAGAPAPLRAELTAAVAVQGSRAPAPWVDAFVESLREDPMLQVVLANASPRDERTESEASTPSP